MRINLGEGKVIEAATAAEAVAALKNLEFFPTGEEESLDEWMLRAAQNIFRLTGRGVRPGEGATQEERCSAFLAECERAGILRVEG